MSLGGVSSTLATSATLSAGVALVTPKLTTTFIPKAASCTGDHFTMLENREFQIWMNMPIPVPGVTMTDCYPDVFMQSFLSSAGGVTQPAFQPLVCPQSYSAIGPYTSNYIACCPSGYGFAGAKETPFADRPAFGGTCYTNIQMATPIIVTKYGLSGIVATTTFSASDSSAQAYAYPYEGTAFGVAQLASITPPPSLGAATTAPTASPTGTGSTHTVIAAAGPTFVPNSVNAKVGDSVAFDFTSANHTITQSTFDSPCSPLANGFDSGYTGNAVGEIVFSVNVSTAQFFYSKQGSECQDGMVFSLNPSTAESAAAFHAAALAQPSLSKSTGLSAGAKAGIAIACIASIGFLCLVALLFLRKRRQVRATEAQRAKEINDYWGSYGSPPPAALQSYHNGQLRNGVTPINTRNLGRAPQPGCSSVLPEKGEELPAVSSPTELATYNQGAVVELQGSEGKRSNHFAAAKTENHTDIRKSSPSSQTEILSPLSGRG